MGGNEGQENNGGIADGRENENGGGRDTKREGEIAASAICNEKRVGEFVDSDKRNFGGDKEGGGGKQVKK